MERPEWSPPATILLGRGSRWKLILTRSFRHDEFWSSFSWPDVLRFHSFRISPGNWVLKRLPSRLKTRKTIASFAAFVFAPAMRSWGPMPSGSPTEEPRKRSERLLRSIPSSVWPAGPVNISAPPEPLKWRWTGSGKSSDPTPGRCVIAGICASD